MEVDSAGDPPAPKIAEQSGLPLNRKVERDEEEGDEEQRFCDEPRVLGRYGLEAGEGVDGGQQEDGVQGPDGGGERVSPGQHGAKGAKVEEEGAEL